MSDETATNLTPVEVESLPDPGELPGIIALLGELKLGAILTEEGVARLFKRHVASVKRAVPDRTRGIECGQRWERSSRMSRSSVQL